jgi:hypothetical protein
MATITRRKTGWYVLVRRKGYRPHLPDEARSLRMGNGTKGRFRPAEFATILAAISQRSLG